MTLPIEAYAVIGDGRSAALVSREGAVDWLCWPRFDSPSIFGALLDEKSGGTWSIRPAGPFLSTRRYLPGTNVLETRFETDSGAAVLTDLMPVASEEEKREALFPDHELLRVVRCEGGEVELEIVYEPRSDYAREIAKLRAHGASGIRTELSHAGLLLLASDVDLDLSVEGVARGRVRLGAGEARRFSLTYEDELPGVVGLPGSHADEAIRRSVAWWRSWIGRMSYGGPAREAVERSALALRLLVYAPSGAVVAAPTTSLPERPGGDLNWDYRYCWLRDASLTARALLGLGFQDETSAFVSWLLQATRLTRPRLTTLYDVHGNAPISERILPHLSGYGGAAPVRIGNAAVSQLQLDVYGEVIDAVVQVVREGKALDRETERLLRGFGEFVCKNWRDPDEGIWEPRSGRRLSTHSRALCWVALDRLIELHEKGHVRRAPIGRFRSERDAIRREIETRAWNPRLGSYVARLDGDELDASLLLLSWYGFERADSERMRSTHARIRERLGARDGLLYRYETGESPGEGAFGICSFWSVEQLALGGGSAEEACAALGDLVGYANDVGLYAEEIDPGTGAALGNFPQAFTHVGLINAALSIERRLRGESVPVGKVPHRDGTSEEVPP